MTLENRIIRIRLTEKEFRKYKVFCAIGDLSMTDQTNRLVRDFLVKSESEIKIMKVGGMDSPLT